MLHPESEYLDQVAVQAFHHGIALEVRIDSKTSYAISGGISSCVIMVTLMADRLGSKSKLRPVRRDMVSITVSKGAS